MSAFSKLWWWGPWFPLPTSPPLTWLPNPSPSPAPPAPVSVKCKMSHGHVRKFDDDGILIRAPRKFWTTIGSGNKLTKPTATSALVSMLCASWTWFRNKDYKAPLSAHLAFCYIPVQCLGELKHLASVDGDVKDPFNSFPHLLALHSFKNVHYTTRTGNMLS